MWLVSKELRSIPLRPPPLLSGKSPRRLRKSNSFWDFATIIGVSYTISLVSHSHYLPLPVSLLSLFGDNCNSRRLRNLNFCCKLRQFYVCLTLIDRSVSSRTPLILLLVVLLSNCMIIGILLSIWVQNLVQRNKTTPQQIVNSWPLLLASASGAITWWGVSLLLWLTMRV